MKTKKVEISDKERIDKSDEGFSRCVISYHTA